MLNSSAISAELRSEFFCNKSSIFMSCLLSSSMVFENISEWPSGESHLKECPPPSSTYGFQKLSCEYFAKGAHEQYGLPYTIVRPFNCIGIGEDKAIGENEITSGNLKLTLSHVVPDLILKCLKGQDPLHILGDGYQVRHYTYGGDLARGIRIGIEHPNAKNEDFNLSTVTSTTVLELAQLIWKKIYKDKPFSYVSDTPFEYDVQKRVPDCSKATKLLNYEATTGLDKILDEVMPWIQEQIQLGNM